MNLDTVLIALVIILAATLICVVFFERVGLGSVVGFIFAGVLVGPHTPGLVATEQVATLQDISELGVVLFLFAVGLEMLPKQLWAMRRQIFGVGLLQVLLTAAPLSAMLVYGFDLHWRSAVLLALGADREHHRRQHGHTSYQFQRAMPAAPEPRQTHFFDSETHSPIFTYNPAGCGSEDNP